MCKNVVYPFVSKVNARISLAHPAVISEWFSEGTIKGEICLIRPSAVVKWLLAKATLPKSAKSQLKPQQNTAHILSAAAYVGLP